MENSTDGIVERIEDMFSDLLGLENKSPQPRSVLNSMVEGAKSKTKPRLIFLNENKEPVTQLRRESFENSDSQDVKKLEEEFYVQLEDPTQAGKGSVTVNLLALDQAGKDRALDGVTLHEVSPGKFISKAQLLLKKKNEEGFLPDLFEDFYPVKKYEVGLGETLLAEYNNGQLKLESEAVCVPTAKLAQVWPAVLNDNGQLVSTLPKQPPFTNVMTEINPAQEKVAHREMQMQFDKSLAGKTVTWTLAPLAIAAIDGGRDAILVGDLKNSPTHKDYFEAANSLGKSDFRRVSQNTAETVIDDEGYTAIRTNLPPIAFNKAQVKVQVEGIPAAQEAANFIVPGVVVIDPGHGGKDYKATLKTSSWNNATSPSGALEKDKTLEVGKALKDEVTALAKERGLPVQVHMTRTTDVNLSAGDRVAVAKNSGADVMLSIHFNGSKDHKVRGAETYYRAAKNNNVNLTEDVQLATSMTQSVERANLEVDPAYQRKGSTTGVVPDTKSNPGKIGVLSDGYMGNTNSYHPARMALVEMDYLTNDRVDGLLKDKKIVGAWAKSMAGSLIDNMVGYHQTAQTAQTPEQKEQKEEKEEEKKSAPKHKIK